MDRRTRDGKGSRMTDILKPIDQMTDEELLALADAMEAEAREHEAHASEIEAYVAARNVKERAAA